MKLKLSLTIGMFCFSVTCFSFSNAVDYNLPNNEPDSSTSLYIEGLSDISWTEIYNDEGVWYLPNYCDTYPPNVYLQNDTLYFSWGDGGFETYIINSFQKIEHIGWKLYVDQIFESPDIPFISSIISVNIIDDDKTDWTFDDGLNNHNIIFLNEEYTYMYPLDESEDCSDFDEEYNQDEEYEE